jgi:uncharacterized ParB-like nuclease family protein
MRAAVRATLGFLLAAGLLLPAVPVAAAASDTGVSTAASVGEVTSVAATTSRIVVSGHLAAGADPAGTSLSLYALDPSQDDSAYSSLTPVARMDAPLAGTSFRISAPRYREAADGYFDKYLVVASGPAGSQPLGAAQYVSSADFPAQYSYPYPQGWDKKGISAVQMTDDAETLGASSSAVNVAVNQIMLAKDLDPADTITFWSDGQPYYFSKAAVTSLDAQLSVLTRDRIYPYLILLITPGDPANSAGPELRFPGADPSANIDAFNTQTATGVAYVTAAARFLASRYLRADARYGQAAGFIVGNEVDSAWIWQNMGQQTLSGFLEYYARAVRIFYQAARLEYARPRVYISLDHEWSVPYETGQPLEYYPGKDVVDGLAALTRAEGDFPWDIAYHPYPQNLADPAFWNDTQATDSPDTQLITFKNLQVLPQYLRQPSVTYAGQPRRVILSEQGFNTPDDSEQSQLLQAAAFAYAYYKVRFLSGIDAFLYYRHVDNQGEGGLRLGLWTWDPNVPEAGAPGTPKYIYNVYRYIDTSRSLRVTNFALPIIGIKSWSQVIPGFNPAELAQRPLEYGAGTRVGVTPVRERVVSSFTAGTSGWLPAENADAVTTASVPGYGSGHALVVHFDDQSGLQSWSTEAKTAKGADVVFGHPVDASATPWLDLAVQVPEPPSGPLQPDDVLHAIVKVYGADNHVAEGAARITAGSGWLPLSVGLADWPELRAIKRIKVWVQGSTDETWLGSYDIGQVGFSADVPASARTNLDIAAAAAQHSPTAGTAVTLTVTNDDTATLTGDLAVGTCSDVTVAPGSVSLDGLAPGATRTAAVTLSAYQPSAAPVLCLSYGGEAFSVPLVLPPPAPHTLYDFSTGTQGWQPGQNVASVATVTSFADGPGVPYGGAAYALDATADAVPASAVKSVSLTPSAPIDLSAADTFFAYLDCYGGAPGATSYQATVTLTSGTQTLTETVPVQHDSWNDVSVDVSSWPYRDDITGVEIGFQAVGSATVWAPHFQLDDIGYTS